MTESPSTTHNLNLLTALCAKLGVHSRYPRVSEQAECLLLDVSGLPPFAYNPSIIQTQGGLWMTYRYHFAGDFRTRLGICRISDGKAVRIQDLPIDGFSVEDARLFMFQMEPWLTWVEAKWEANFVNPKSVVKFAKLELPHNDNPALRLWQATRTYQPEFGGNDWSGIQKNWCFFEGYREILLCIFGTSPEQMIMKVSGDKAIAQWNTKPLQWPYGTARGGSILSYDGKLLHFFHSRTDTGRERRYFVGARLLESQPPFQTIAVSKKPILYGSEVDALTPAQRKSCPHWKRNVIFPCGAIQDGDGWLLSAGINDAACALITIKSNMLNL
jgi:hypothetical protein